MNEDKRDRDVDQPATDSDTRPYHLETAAEIAEPLPFREEDAADGEHEGGGKTMGYIGLVLSIISFFALPILFGAAGIILGFLARRRGEENVGAWAIGLGAVSIIVGIFVLPFF